MKKLASLLLYVLFTASGYGQVRETLSPECERVKYSQEKPISCWIELLNGGIPSTRKWAVEALAKLGPRAGVAVPALAVHLKDEDWQVRIAVVDALEKVAGGDPDSAATDALIEALKDNSPKSVRGSALQALYAIWGKADASRVSAEPLAGWFGIFQMMPRGYAYRFERPVVSADGKAYSQTMHYSWMGGRVDYGSYTLARDPMFKERYSAESLRRDAHPPRALKVGGRSAWLWDSGDGYRLVILLGVDKAWIVERHGGPISNASPESNPEDASFFARAEAALNAPPRTDFRLTPNTFNVLKKGSLISDVVLWLGGSTLSCQDVGDGMCVMEYRLSDFSSVMLRFDKTEGDPEPPYALHEDRWHWRLMFGVQVTTSGVRHRLF